MLAAYAARTAPGDPLSALEIGDVPEPLAREGWTTVRVEAASLNRHDLWSLRGVGLTEDRLPMVLGCDAAGVTDDGREVIVHAVIGGPGAPAGQAVAPDEQRTILSERYPGTLAERVAVPTTNLVDKPPAMSWEHAACLPTAYLTAYRALFRDGRAQPGQRVLVQGAGGGFATAAIQLGSAAGLDVTVTSRDEARRARATALGATAVATGARIPRVDLVLESVGAATWEHTMRSVRPGGTVVVVGATTGDPSPMQVTRLFFQEITVRGATMGTRDELAQLVAFVAQKRIEPPVDSSYALKDARAAFERLASGEQFGKVVVLP